MITRISSTQIRTFLACPRKWHYAYVQGQAQVFGFAAAVGTVFHAIQEYRMSNGGKFPTRKQVEAMPGNYESTRKTVRSFPNTWQVAKNMAQQVDPYELEFINHDNDLKLEYNLQDNPLDLGHGIVAGGYLDIIDMTTHTVIDWKTRKSFGHAPKTHQGFRDDIQQMYYAAACSIQFGWEEVGIYHINVKRVEQDRPTAVKVYGTTFSSDELRTWWEDVLKGEIVPAMVKAARSPIEDVARNTKTCWKYGKQNPCAYLQTCNPREETNNDLDFNIPLMDTVKNTEVVQDDWFGHITRRRR